MVQKMSLKVISYLELWQPHCPANQNHLCNFGRRHNEEQFCEISFEFGPAVQEEMRFNGVTFLGLWQPFCSAECNNLCNFGRRYLKGTIM